jgi:hypothetical protein
MNGEKRSSFLTALFNPVNLGMLALVAAAGLCAAWWLAPAGLLLWLVMLAVIYRDPALRLNNIVESRVTLAQRLQAPFERVEKAQISLFNNLASAGPGARRSLQPVQAAVDRLVDQVYRLSLRMSALQNHLLVSRTGQDPQVSLDQLKEKLSTTTDPAVKQDLEASVHTLEGQIGNLSSISSTLDRFEAQLTALSSALENVVTQTVQLAAQDRSSRKIELPGVLQSIRDQAQSLEEFEKTIA